MRAFGLQILGRLAEKGTARVLRASADAIFGGGGGSSSSSKKAALASVQSSYSPSIISSSSDNIYNGDGKITLSKKSKGKIASVGSGSRK